MLALTHLVLLSGLYLQSSYGRAVVGVDMVQRLDANPATSEAASSATDSSTGTATSQEPSTSASATQSYDPSTSSESSSSTPISVSPTITGSAATSTGAYNVTAIPAGELPLQPEVTPGFAVAGVILLITGFAYTLIGIKNKWLHISLSAGYLASLATTVLILYVMNPPISNGIQGAYVVAVVLTGAIVGGASLTFTEITEGLGCLLGGFCFSMWLLVLQPGGLLKGSGSICGFIAAFTIAGFATSFHHTTRPYGLIVLISFAGATVLVMGVDCFSRAGLKEFWAYIWNLNQNLFPLGADTYPLTRGIKVEIAAIIIVFLIGIISQMRMWKMVQERRNNRAAARLENERALQSEEEGVGRKVENDLARDRQDWEATYGEKDSTRRGLTPDDSGIGDMDSSKKGPRSVVTSVRPSYDEREIPMDDMPRNMDATVSRPVSWMPEDQGGNIMTTTISEADGQAIFEMEGENVQPRRVTHKASSKELDTTTKPDPTQETPETQSQALPTVTEAPEVVPLPLPVPESEEVADNASVRSSLVAAADEEPVTSPVNKRLTGLQSLRRSLSGSSKRSSTGSQTSARKLSGRHGGISTSSEKLVVAHHDDDDASVAATMDDLSDDEDRAFVNTDFQPSPMGSSPTKHSFADVSPITKNFDMQLKSNVADHDLATEEAIAGFPFPDLLEEEADRVNIVDTPTPASRKRGKEGQKSKSSTLVERNPTTPALTFSPSEYREYDEPALPLQSPLKKENLPTAPPRIAMTYRTNEWAKHISNAEAPEFDELNQFQPAADSDEQDAGDLPVTEEQPVPVNIEELQQTAGGTRVLPAPALRNFSNKSNNTLAPQSHVRSTSNPQTLAKQIFKSASNPAHGTPQKLRVQKRLSIPLYSSDAPNTNTSANKDDAVTELPVPGRFPPRHSFTGAPQTLIGQRETMMRSKSSQLLQVYNNEENTNGTSTPNSEESDNISLRARKELIRQQSLNQLDPSYKPEAPSKLSRSVSASPTTAFQNTLLPPQRQSALQGQPSVSAQLQKLIPQHGRSGSALSSLPSQTLIPEYMAASQSPAQAQQRQSMQRVSSTPNVLNQHQTPQHSRQASQNPRPTQAQRDSALQSFRQRVAQDLVKGNTPAQEMENSRQRLWEEKELGRKREEKMRAERERREMYRNRAIRRVSSGGQGLAGKGGVDMHEAHRAAMRRMQARANQGAVSK